MQIEKYVRKPFPVDCVQLTIDNFRDVLNWCDGAIQFTSKDHKKGEGVAFIKIKVRGAGVKEDQSQAFAGDWILKVGPSFRVYSDKALKQNFQPVDVVTAAVG